MNKRKAHRLDLTGQTFNLWTVKSRSHTNEWGVVYWLCTCECGTERPVQARSLTSGTSRSCGCYHKSRVTNHGYTGSPTFYTWQSMKQRCHYPKAKSYKHYGGRGIVVCDRWRHSFENFLEDMGERPDGCSLDRIDYDGPYSPENCRWADHKTQQRNRPDATVLTYNGMTKNLYDWAAEYGKTGKQVYDRICAGWSVEDALNKPMRKLRKD